MSSSHSEFSLADLAGGASQARPDAVESPFAVSGQAVYEHLHADAYEAKGDKCPVEPPKKPEFDLLAELRNALGPQVFGPIWSVGQQLSKGAGKNFDITDCFK